MPKTLTLAFSDEATSRLAALRLKTQADSDGEVVRNALRIYEWHIEQAESGHQIGLYDKDGQPMKIIKIFL